MFVIAGVSGHVGSAAAKALLAAKKQVKVLVRDAAKGQAWAQQGATVAVGALEDTAFLTGALKGAEGFFVLIPPHYKGPDLFAEQKALGDAIAAAVKASGVPHVALLSSVGADLPAGTGPIRGLHHLENALRATGTTLSAIRAGYFQENIANSLAPAKAMGLFFNFMASADYPVPMIATADIGRLAAECLLHKPAKSETIDLQGPAYSIRQAAALLGKALGKELKVVDVPAAEHVEAMKKGGVPEHMAKAYAEMYAGFATGKIVPKGDRAVQGKGRLEDVVAALTAA